MCMVVHLYVSAHTYIHTYIGACMHTYIERERDTRISTFIQMNGPAHLLTVGSWKGHVLAQACLSLPQGS